MRHVQIFLLAIVGLQLTSVQYHSGKTNSSFDVSSGKKITAGLLNLSAEFDLSAPFGTAPQDYYLSRYGPVFLYHIHALR